MIVDVALGATPMKLTDLPIGTSARIREYGSSELALKLMEMGCVPGEDIVVEQVAPLGDPICIRIAGYTLSLRKGEAAEIQVEPNGAL